jgi:Sulfotransferase family
MLQHVLKKRRKNGVASSDDRGLTAFLLEHIEQSGLIRCPLVLISQISRSGGTWMSQLFDHHPQVWAHPRELKIGYPRKWDWPDLSSVADARDAWSILRYKKAEERLGTGAYYKGTNETYPIVFSVDIQQLLFLELAGRHQPSTEREWLDIYFTSFFYAWLDYQRRYGPKRFVTVFSSMLAMEPTFMAKFRVAYPDGYLISVLREPLGWYASVRGRSLQGKEASTKMMRHYAGPEEAESAYLDNVEAMRRNRENFGERFIVLDYEALVHDTEKEMRALAARIGLDWHECLTRQTFNGMSIHPNTSFQGETSSARSSILTEEVVDHINNGPMMAAYRSILEEHGLAPQIRPTQQ